MQATASNVNPSTAAKALQFLSFTLAPEQIKPAPEMGSVLDTGYLIGLGTLDEPMLILVDIDKLMPSDEMGLAPQAVQ